MTSSAHDPTTTRPPVTLGEVAEAVGGAVLGDPSTRLSDVTQDSRRSAPGSLYAARRGHRSDGRAFIPDALRLGASALLVDDAEAARAAGAPAVVVRDARAAVGHASSVVHGRPFDRLSVVGVTGTNGKTTTASLVASILAACGGRPAVLGTLGCSFEGHDLGGERTTPEADDLTRTAARLVAMGATHLAMEVSSHALTLDRVEHVRFEAAGFTNLTQDHLDFHETMEAYGAAKARLFTELRPRASVIHLGGESEAYAAALLDRAAGERWGVSRHELPGARLRALSSRLAVTGTEALVSLDGRTHALRSPLVGLHNIENLLVAAGLALSLGLEPGAVFGALASAPAVPGRLERCSGEGDDVLVVVDYAHTPDALVRVLAALRRLSEGQIWCVFGCGGDRDPHKRPKMGEAAARGADRLIVTNDNPRSEEPAAIARAVVAGVERAGATCQVILDRAEAIAVAVRSAAPGDVVLIAGKGHEPYQIIGATTRPFDDRVEARQSLSLRRG